MYDGETSARGWMLQEQKDIDGLGSIEELGGRGGEEGYKCEYDTHTHTAPHHKTHSCILRDSQTSRTIRQLRKTGAYRGLTSYNDNNDNNKNKNNNNKNSRNNITTTTIRERKSKMKHTFTVIPLLRLSASNPFHSPIRSVYRTSSVLHTFFLR